MTKRKFDLPRGNWRPDQPVRSSLRDSARSDWFRISAQDGDTTDVWIYDEIGWFGITAADFVARLEQVDTPHIDVHINSPGGDVFDGIAIYTALRNHDARVTTSIEGLAASAASFIAQAGEERRIAPNAMIMIHDAFGVTVGPAADHSHMADLLDKISDNMASIYADQSAQGSARSWRDLMLNETWYDADEAVAAGLADRVDEPEAPSDESVAARMAAAFDLSIFAHAGRQNAPAPFLVAAQKVSTVAAARVDPEPKERKHMNMDTFVALLVAASEERRSELIGNHADLLEENGVTAADVRLLVTAAIAKAEVKPTPANIPELVETAAGLPEEARPSYVERHRDAIEAAGVTGEHFDALVARQVERDTPPPQPVNIAAAAPVTGITTRPRFPLERWASLDIAVQAASMGVSKLADPAAQIELDNLARQYAVQAALDTTTTTLTVGIVPPQYTSEVLAGLPVHTPLADNCVRRAELPAVGMSIVKPAWTVLPEGDWYTTENTEPASDAIAIGTRTVNVLSWGHAVRASINAVERSTFGGLAQNYYTQAVISYMSDKEARIAEEMMDAVVLHNGLVNTTADTTVKAKIGTLVTAVINQQADGNGNFRGLAPDFAALATDVYEDLSTVDTDAGVAFGSGNAQIGSMMGTLGTLRIVLAPGLDSGGIIVGAAAATELRDGNELQLRSLIVNTLSYELGVNANCSIDVEYPNALAANNDAFS